MSAEVLLVPVMKKRAVFALLLFLLGSLSIFTSGTVFTSLQFVSLAKANPYSFFWEYIPPDKYTEAPVISVSSPANNTVFNTDNIVLSFNVDVGESETATSTGLFYVNYQTDWQHDNEHFFYPDSSPFAYEVNLTGIPEGTHSITFEANERGSYNSTHAFSIDGYETIYFTIDTSQETKIPEFPAWIILPLFLSSTLAVAVYRKKLTKKPSQQSY
jgi:hypothetical protein